MVAPGKAGDATGETGAATQGAPAVAGCAWAKCIPHRYGSKAAAHAKAERRPNGRRHLRSNNTTSRTMDPRKEKGRQKCKALRPA